MAKYLWMKQSGEGCDYTIACGQTLIELKSDNPNEIIEILEYYGVSSKDVQLDDAQIVTFVESAMPLVEKFINQQREENEEFDRQKKRDQIKRLQSEIGE